MSRLLAWGRRWGISVASLVGGLLALFVFRRELPHFSWIIGSLLLLWLLAGTLVQVREAFESRGPHTRLVVTAADYTLQSLYHGILLFCLPAYYASATLSSANVIFLAVLVVLVLLATFDPWYQAVVHPRPWLRHVFFLVSVFTALNVALPLVGVPPFVALLLAAWLSVVAFTPAVQRARRWPWRRALEVTTVLALGAAAAAGLGRAFIPPAPLFLARAGLGWEPPRGDEFEPVTSPITAAELRRRGLVAFTAVHAPAGLSQPIAHVWRHDGRVVNVVSLSPVRGGRREGFRTYSRKTSFPPDVTGRWSIDVVTSAGQLIGRLRFRVTG